MAILSLSTVVLIIKYGSTYPIKYGSTYPIKYGSTYH